MEIYSDIPNCFVAGSGMLDIFPGKRNVILSRSTFVGSGKNVIHWLGDNSAEWSQMAMSVVGKSHMTFNGWEMITQQPGHRWPCLSWV